MNKHVEDSAVVFSERSVFFHLPRHRLGADGGRAADGDADSTSGRYLSREHFVRSLFRDVSARGESAGRTEIRWLAGYSGSQWFEHGAVDAKCERGESGERPGRGESV